jgi:hypothetical protein
LVQLLGELTPGQFGEETAPDSGRGEEASPAGADHEAVKELVKRYKAEVQALARARTRLRTTGAAVSPLREEAPDASSPRSSVASPDAVGAGSGAANEENNWLLDWGEEAPPAVINAAHPAVAVARSQAVRGGGSPRRAVNATSSAAYSSQGSRRADWEDTAEAAEEETGDYEPGWLPPLPPRSAEAPVSNSSRPGSSGSGAAAVWGNRSALSGGQGYGQARSPSSKSLRLQPAGAAPSAVFRGNNGAGGVDSGAGAGAGYARQRGQQQSNHRATRASNVLSSMSTFLSGEVLAAAEQGDSMRI